MQQQYVRAMMLAYLGGIMAEGRLPVSALIECLMYMLIALLCAKAMGIHIEFEIIHSDFFEYLESVRVPSSIEHRHIGPV